MIQLPFPSTIEATWGGATTGPDATPPRAICQNLRGAGGGGGQLGGCDLIKKQTNANQRQCTPQSDISASLFSMPNLVEPQDTHCV